MAIVGFIRPTKDFLAVIRGGVEIQYMDTKKNF